MNGNVSAGREAPDLHQMIASGAVYKHTYWFRASVNVVAMIRTTTPVVKQ